MEELSTKQKGDISEMRVLAKLTELGVDTYLPFGEDTKADLIADTGSELVKIQVKTARSTSLRDTTIEFNCYSTQSNFSDTEDIAYDKDGVDGFAVFWPKEEELYYVPIGHSTKTKMSIRRVLPDNNQKKGINFAEDYDLTERFK